MTEKDVISKTRTLVTRASLARELNQLGVKAGMIVLVHTSMSKLGWVCGGPVAIISALQDVLTGSGTLVMPAHSADVSDPKDWENPAVPQEWREDIYKEMPVFDPVRTPTCGIGRVAECFRTFPGVKRSFHPIHSFAAWGKERDGILARQSLDDGLGEDSPIEKLYEKGGYVLLLGAGYDSNTSMHLGEYRSKCLRSVTRASPLLERGRRVWKHYLDLDFHEERFPEIGAAFERRAGRQNRHVRIGRAGAAQARLISQRALVDFTAEYIKRHAGSDS